MKRDFENYPATYKVGDEIWVLHDSYVYKTTITEIEYSDEELYDVESQQEHVELDSYLIKPVNVSNKWKQKWVFATDLLTEEQSLDYMD